MTDTTPEPPAGEEELGGELGDEGAGPESENLEESESEAAESEGGDAG